MSVPTTHDIRLGTIDQATGAVTDYGYMVENGAVKQDITPASTRRTDGDTRFQELQTEGYWARVDWSGGHGVARDVDVTSYAAGPADTTTPGEITMPQRVAYRMPVGGEGYKVDLFFEHGGVTYCYMEVSVGSWQMFQWNPGSLSWTAVTGVAAFAVRPTCVASYRNKVYFGFGSGAQMYVWNVTATSPVIFSPTIYVYKLAVYGSMLHMLSVNSGNTAWAIWRYDIDNSDTRQVAVFGFPIADNESMGMVVAYGSLWVTFKRTLWQYTTQNGNLGVLTGPHDRYVNTDYSGLGLTAHDGALVYNGGYSVRRYVPGGLARTLYPVPPREAGYEYSWGQPTAMISIRGKLYITWVDASAGSDSGIANPLQYYRVSVWTGQGMHFLCDHSYMTGTSTVATMTRMHFDNMFFLHLGLPVSSSVLTPAVAGTNPQLTALGTLYVPFKTSGVQREIADYGSSVSSYILFDELRFISSWIDFGLADVVKALRYVRIQALINLLAGQVTSGTLFVWYQTDADPGTTWRALARVDNGSTTIATSDGKEQVYVLEPKVSAPVLPYITFRRLRFKVNGAIQVFNGAYSLPIVRMIGAQANPVMPVRFGFRLSVQIAQQVLDHQGARLYADEPAVKAALARVEGYRSLATGMPLQLTWLDGTVYRVRANTMTTTMLANEKGQHMTWLVSFDLQEIS